MAAINPAAHALPADSLASKLVVNRAPDHTEPAVFPAVASATSPSQGPCADAGAAQQLSDTQMVRLRSVNSDHPCIVEFVNATTEYIHTIWLDFAGNEIYYTSIEPLTKRKYRSYISHPWIIRALKDNRRLMLGQRMVFIASEAEQSVVITDAPLLPWTLSNHAHFPADFKASIRALLLSHRRLCNSPHPSSPASNTISAAGTPATPELSGAGAPSSPHGAGDAGNHPMGSFTVAPGYGHYTTPFATPQSSFSFAAAGSAGASGLMHPTSALLHHAFGDGTAALLGSPPDGRSTAPPLGSQPTAVTATPSPSSFSLDLMDTSDEEGPLSASDAVVNLTAPLVDGKPGNPKDTNGTGPAPPPMLRIGPLSTCSSSACLSSCPSSQLPSSGSADAQVSPCVPGSSGDALTAVHQAHLDQQLQHLSQLGSLHFQQGRSHFPAAGHSSGMGAANITSHMLGGGDQEMQDARAAAAPPAVGSTPTASPAAAAAAAAAAFVNPFASAASQISLLGVDTQTTLPHPAQHQTSNAVVRSLFTAPAGAAATAPAALTVGAHAAGAALPASGAAAASVLLWPGSSSGQAPAPPLQVPHGTVSLAGGPAPAPAPHAQRPPLSPCAKLTRFMRCIKGIVKSARYAGSYDSGEPSSLSLVQRSPASGTPLNPGAAAFVPGAIFSARVPSSGTTAASPVKQRPACWERMADLPEHLILHIVSYMAPVIRQCVSHPRPAMYPDILPALLTSDPATWPPLAGEQQQGQGQEQQEGPANAEQQGQVAGQQQGAVHPALLQVQGMFELGQQQAGAQVQGLQHQGVVGGYAGQEGGDDGDEEMEDVEGAPELLFAQMQ